MPIVIGTVLFDLGIGDATVRPDATAGYAACVAASTEPVVPGPVGAGAGATVSKWRGPEHARPAGIGSAAVRHDDLIVAAIVVVNAFGDVLATGEPSPIDVGGSLLEGVPFEESTTIGAVVTNASLDKTGCFLVAQGAHDGLARAVAPVHTQADGDAFVAAATGEVPAASRPRPGSGGESDRGRDSVSSRRRRVKAGQGRTVGGVPVLAEVEREALACTRCKLADGRTQVVFGMGNPEADLVFCGEGPGAEEDRQGLPFVGRVRSAARPADARGDRHRPRRGASSERGEVPAAGQPRPRTRRDRGVPAVARASSSTSSTRRSSSRLGNFATKLLLETTEGITKLRGKVYPSAHGRARPHLPSRRRAAGRRARRWPRCAPTSSGPSRRSRGAG